MLSSVTASGITTPSCFPARATVHVRVTVVHFYLYVHSQTAREFDSLFTGEFSGMGTAARVANNSTALSEWDAATKARLNLPHIAHAVNSPPADADDEFVWLIQVPDWSCLCRVLSCTLCNRVLVKPHVCLFKRVVVCAVFVASLPLPSKTLLLSVCFPTRSLLSLLLLLLVLLLLLSWLLLGVWRVLESV